MTTRTAMPRPAAAVPVSVLLLMLSPCVCLGLEKEKSLVTGEVVGELAVAGMLDVDLHAEFMVSRTFENDTALHWYNCGFSGGGARNDVGGSFGDFGLHVPHAERDDKYPHWVEAAEAPAVRFDGNDIMKANFAVEPSAAGTEDMALEVWVRDESPAGAEVILGWQSEDGRETSAPLSYPTDFRGSGKWRHVLVNCKGATETWYLDGRKLASGETKWSETARLVCEKPKAFVQDAGPDGLVVMEAENFTRKVAAPDGHEWKAETRRKGYVGASAMQAMPDRGGQQNADVAARSPRLDFAIDFAKKGRHWVWVRALGVNYNGDSLHFGLDLEPADWGMNAQTGTGKYVWKKHPKPFQVKEPGVHTLSVWMREDGVILDRVLVTSSPGFKVKGESDHATQGTKGDGPPESRRR